MRTATCKKCNAQIFNMKTDGGKAFPCEIELVMYWQNKRGGQIIITPNGEILKANLNGDINKATGYGYAVHKCNNHPTTA